MRLFLVKFLVSVVLAAVVSQPLVFAQSSDVRFPTKREESPETWRRGGLERIRDAQKMRLRKKKAKNVIRLSLTVHASE